MRAGLMRRKIDIQTITLTPDGGGGFTETPTTVSNIPARVEPLEASEQLEAMSIDMKRAHRFTIRYRTGMTGAKRIVYDGRTFDVKSVVDPEEQHRELQILTEEII